MASWSSHDEQVLSPSYEKEKNCIKCVMEDYLTVTEGLTAETLTSGKHKEFA